MKKKKKVRSKKAPKKKSDIQSDFLRLERADYCFDKGLKSWDNGRLQKALLYFKKALKAYPDDESVGRALVDLGREMGKDDVVLYGYSHLFRLGELGIESYSEFINLLIDDQKYQRALKILEEYRFLIADFGLPAKKKNSHLKQIIGIEEYCRKLLEEQKAGLKKPGLRKEGGKEEKNSTVPEKDESGQESPPQEAETKQEESPPAIPVTLEFDSGSFHSILSEKKFMPPEVLEATIEAYRIRFRNSFESLICLPLLPGIEFFWYQVETVRKVLKTFRGRAMLADEVGLGKTIEAGMVLREYIERGMVQNALILTPTPLVSQWKEELRVKFGLDFFSTDDPGIKINREFWQASFVLASINHAKSRKNFSEVTEREYDMVIVDEAHHLKNKNTLNWKLVNSLKKRFLLFLTATPVENNLMELYNLITLLKPGLLKTSSEFKNEFVTRGDSVSPRNRERLKGLLDRVMIRNTRALAAINIPPRYARTVRVVPDPGELRLYETITSLVSRIRQSGRLRKRLLLKNLLGEAGSSPRALAMTLERLQRDNDDRLARFRDEIEALGNLCRSITGETGKNRALLHLLKNTRGKMIIFVKYLGTLEEISDYLAWKRIPHLTFHGGLTNQQKDKAVDLFRDAKDILVTTEIGGEGRNLQFCHQMINYDLPWNPMKIEQRIGRLHRLGQQNEVMIYNFCGEGSLEEHILEILDKKINMFEMVIGEIEMILGRVRGEKDFGDMVYDIWVDSESEEERSREFARLGTRIKRCKNQYGKTRELDDKLFGEDYEV